MDYNVIINNLLNQQFLYHLGEHNFLFPLIYEPHIVTASLLFGLWYLDELFSITLWPIVRPYRNKFKGWFKLKVKKCMR